MRPTIEAVTTCVGYDDFLAAVIPFNRPHLSRWIIVTAPDDHRTLDLCRAQNLECVATRDFYRHGDEFNKGRAIERGLAMLSHREWVLHLDSDIALPGDFTESLQDADLDPACIYGSDRLMIKGYDTWTKVKHDGSHRRSWHYLVGTRGIPIGDRWADIRYGYVPIGFFQLWHPDSDTRQGIRLRRYPDCHSDACRSDVKFGLQWDRRHRVLIPEVLVAHLESEPAKLGANWKGRKTKRFGPHVHHHPGKPCS